MLKHCLTNKIWNDPTNQRRMPGDVDWIDTDVVFDIDELFVNGTLTEIIEGITPIQSAPDPAPIDVIEPAAAIPPEDGVG